VILDWFVRHKRFGKFKKVFHRTALPLRPLATFPKIIHVYWDQGFDDAPKLVQQCVRSWREQNAGWEVRLWDHARADELVAWSSLPTGLKITPYSDILRTEILKEHGGVWADSTVLCTRPLDWWLLPIVCQTDFFAFSRPGPDREIASWFLAARPNSTVVRSLSKAVTDFWSRQNEPTRVYHWFQYIFEYLERTSPAFRKEWHTAPRISAAPMLLLQERLSGGKVPDPAEEQMLQSMPMHKLTHKQPIDLAEVERLLDRA
jgi:hypothetical protein